MTITESLPVSPVDVPRRSDGLGRSIRIALAIYLLPVVALICLIGLASIVMLSLARFVRHLAATGHFVDGTRQSSIGPSMVTRTLPAMRPVLREDRVRT